MGRCGRTERPILAVAQIVEEPRTSPSHDNDRLEASQELRERRGRHERVFLSHPAALLRVTEHLGAELDGGGCGAASLQADDRFSS